MFVAGIRRAITHVAIVSNTQKKKYLQEATFKNEKQNLIFSYISARREPKGLVYSHMKHQILAHSVNKRVKLFTASESKHAISYENRQN